MIVKTTTGIIDYTGTMVYNNPLPLIMGNTVIGTGSFDGQNIDYTVYDQDYFNSKCIDQNILGVSDITVIPYGFASKRDQQGNPTEFKIKCLYADKNNN